MILFLSQISFAQCDFDPTITGDVILCPNSSSTISTQEYDNYQWYKRQFSEPNPVPIAGEKSQSITISNPTDVFYYYSVEATLDGCTEFSPEVLIDAWAFIPVTVISLGDFTIGNNGESIVCNGDTMYFELNQPYTTNITWFKNGEAIANDTTTTLTVTSPGQYTVTAAPGICPDYVQSLGLTLEVAFIECSSKVEEDFIENKNVLIYPNPAIDQIHVKSEIEEILNLSIYNGFGQKPYSKAIGSKTATIDVSDFQKGLYILEFQMETNTEFHKLIIQ